MINIRGIAVLGSFAFVRDSYGLPAHDRILEALPADQRARLLSPLREASWTPLRDLAAYVETARVSLAPNQREFYRKLGHFVGRVERERGGFRPMVADPSAAMRLAPLVWSALYDSGRMESLVKGPKEALLRIHGFKTSRPLCDSNCGAIEGLGCGEHMLAHVDETACAAGGSEYCEFRVVWE